MRLFEFEMVDEVSGFGSTFVKETKGTQEQNPRHMSSFLEKGVFGIGR